MDTIPPTAVFPADLTVDCANVGNINITGVPTMVSDNCDTLAFYTQLPDTLVAGSCDHSYVLKRPWLITDACNNSLQGLQIITVTDNKNPVVGTQAQNRTITCDDAVDADSVFNAWVATHGNAVAADNCTGSIDLSWFAYNAADQLPNRHPHRHRPRPVRCTADTGTPRNY
ncbi:MAG: hypothetical protein IPM82_04295 [Saprospiraceae bacterium]|nr:hypothetical protein [Saprospiraceae bacterium]